MNGNDIKLKIQALIDNELPESEIEPLLKRIESSYEYRQEYVELKKLARRLEGVASPEPPEEWFLRVQRRFSRRLSSVVGKVLFFGSYVALIAYAVYQLLADPAEDLLVKLLIGGILVGFLALLGITISDRMVERKTDKYRGVIR
jgi:hypothetical protein